MTAVEVVALVVVVVAAMFVVQWARRRRADQAASELGGAVVIGPLPTPQQPVDPPPGNIGTPNPALPPATAPDQRTGVLTNGPPVELSICGLPALVWQRSEQSDNHWQPMRLSLIADTSVGLPVLHVHHRGGMLGALGDRFADAQTPTGIAALDRTYRFSGDVAAWAPVFGSPAVQQALLACPSLDSLSVIGGRITLVSRDGVRLDPGATSALAQVAAALISAVPPHLTSAAATPPASAGTDPDAMVRNVLSQSGLSVEQQNTMLALVRASQQR